jgi:hypothetical protein
VVRTTLASAVLALAILAPAAQAQELDVARGTATQVNGPDTITYELEATELETPGPLGETASGFITRSFVGLDGNSLVIADVTCLAVSENRAVVIGRVRPESVNVGFEALLVQIFDGTPELQPDGVSSGTDPQFGGDTTFTECGAFLPPFPFNTRPITAGDFQVIDGAEPPPPPPPPPPPDECEDGDDDGGDDDCDDGGGDG